MSKPYFILLIGTLLPPLFPSVLGYKNLLSWGVFGKVPLSRGLRVVKKKESGVEERRNVEWVGGWF